MKDAVKFKKVLLIEDDKLDQMAFERSVKEGHYPYDYEIAGSIAAARKILSEKKFDIIITDYQLRDGVSMEILNLNLPMPIIMTTGTGDEETAVKAMKAGACDYLIKDPDRNYLKILPTTVELALKRWQNERQIALLSHAMRSVSDSVFITDSAGKIIFVNQAFCDTYGYSEEEILGKPSKLLWEESAVDTFHQKKNGVSFPVLFSSSSVKEDAGQDTAIVSISRDMTEFRKAEKILLQKTEELARSRTELEQMQLFAFAATHDLQEPLHKIITFIDLLKHKSASQLDDHGKDVLERVADGAERMRSMMEQLRDLARVSTSERVFGRVDLNQILKEVMDDLKARITETQAQIEADNLPVIEADAFQIRQLFLNLLSNALKFCIPGQAPRISIKSQTVSQGDREFVQMTVTDQGIGFDEKYRDRLFKPFQRLHTRQEYPGSGIGLAICNRIVSHHGGNITFQSIPNKGTSFIIQFPKL